MIDLKVVLFAMKSFPDENYRWTYNEKVKLLERAIKAEAEVEMLKEGLERIKTNIEEYHPHNTLALPKFRFAKEYHDIAIQALKELEVSHE